jgi:GTP-binding protein
VFLGKPNVGKSSLMNLVVQQERSLVSPQAGTTREAVSDIITFYKADIQVTDTPGIRRKRGVTEPLEMLMVKSALRASDNADIVFLLVDASEGKLSDQELKLAFYVFDNYKALILVFNKQDLIDDVAKHTLEHNVEEYDYFLKKIPQITVSCKTGKNVGKILPLAQKVWEHYSQKFNNEELTMLFRTALQRKPLYHKTELLALYEVQQLATAPITLLLTVNEPQWFGQSQLGFLDNLMRDNFELTGAPIKFLLRKAKTTK